jgi:hypothetical protein
VERESVPGQIEMTGRLGREPARGWGGGVRWRRFLGDGPDLLDAEASLLFRAANFGVDVAAGSLLRPPDSVGRGRTTASVQVRRDLLASGSLTLYPSEAGWAPEFDAGLFAAAEAWMAAIEIASVGSFRFSLGARVLPGLFWSATFENFTPGIGIDLSLPVGEIRVDHHRHGLLGGVTQACWVLGGLP